MRKIELYLEKTADGLVFDNVKNVYQKGSFFCIHTSSEAGDYVYRYPISHIFCVKEEYGKHLRDES